MIDKEKLNSKIQALQEELNNQTNAYDYEKTFDQGWQEITREVYQESFGAVPKDRNKKNASK
jgi:uncharacterized protein YigA (DUF484 family)